MRKEVKRKTVRRGVGGLASFFLGGGSAGAGLLHGREEGTVNLYGHISTGRECCSRQ